MQERLLSIERGDGKAIMAKQLDAERIERERNRHHVGNRREEEKQKIRDTIERNRSGERKVRVIMPTHQLYANEESECVRVAAYCRVSTAEEEQAGSFEMQIQHFTSVIENTPNYQMVEIYTDEGVSGTSVYHRKGFQRMIADAEAGKIDLILTKSISRFGRNIVDVISTLRKLNNLTPPVVVRFESEGLNSIDGGNAIIITVLSAAAEMESQQKSIAIKEGIRYRMQEGLYKFSVANTIGYYRDYSGRIKIEPAEAEIVRYIYDLFLEGVSPQDIAYALTEQRIRSPKGMERWTAGTILSILSNEKYCGDVLYQKTYSKDYLSHKTVRNKSVLPQYYWENNHPAIVTRAVWERTRELIALGKRRSYKKQRSAMPSRFTVTRIKRGVLCGFLLLDMKWTKEEWRIFFQCVENKLDYMEIEGNTNYGN